MKRLKIKLTTTILLVIGISTIILGLFMADLIEEIYVDALADRLVEEANMINTIIVKEDLVGEEELNNISKEIGDQLATRITIIDNNGKVLADSQYDKNKMENHGDRPEIVQAYLGETGKEIRYSETLGIEMLYVASPIYQDNQLLGVIRLALPLDSIMSSITTFWNTLIFGLIIIFFIAIIISYRVSDKITRPIINMTRIAKKITNREYNERLDVNRKDEIGQLGSAINLMAESLQEQLTRISENEEKLMTVLNNMSSGVILIDNNGRIILANPAVEWLLGEVIDDLIGKNHFEAGKQDSISDLIEHTLTTGETIHTEIGISYPTKKYLNSNVVPIFDAKGNVNGVLAVLHDITKIKKLENMRTEFVANVSHELRTPITAVKGFAETLLDGSIKDEETSRQFLQIIYNESDRLYRMIVDLLDLSKIELNKDILKIANIDLKTLIQDTLETMGPEINKKNIEILYYLNPVYAEVDEDRIKQVIINLLNNALTYTPENGTIIIRLDEFGKDKVKIEVEDTGIGIPSKNLSRIFERFYRVDKARSRESGGTGLGLAIVKHIIESHGGNIQVESEVGKGTKFKILLPKVQHR